MGFVHRNNFCEIKYFERFNPGNICNDWEMQRDEDKERREKSLEKEERGDLVFGGGKEKQRNGIIK